MADTPRPAAEAEKPKPITKPQNDGPQRDYKRSNTAQRSLSDGEDT